MKIGVNGRMYRLDCTCGACPEQYDVVDVQTGDQVGYLRLRHGRFAARYPDAGGEVVYKDHPRGDGIFDEDERDGFLNAAVIALDAERA